MKHAGHAIQSLLLHNGISVTHTAKHMGIQRSTLYNLFEKPHWPLHRIQAIERLTHQDLRTLYPQSEYTSPNSYEFRLEQNKFLQEEISQYKSLLDEAWQEIAKLQEIIAKFNRNS